MSKTSCRVINNTTRELAKKVFDGNVIVAWCVIPRYMETHNIDDESDINPVQLAEYWKAQTNNQRALLAMLPPYKKRKHDTKYDGTIGAVLNKDGSIALDYIEGVDKDTYLAKWYSQHPQVFKLPNVMQKITTPLDMNVFELAKAKAISLYPYMSEDEINQKALESVDRYHTLKGYNSLKYTLIESLPNGALASTSPNSDTITIKKNISVDDFYDYITGNNNSITAQQKKAVLEELKNTYGITLDDIKAVVNNPYQVRRFILEHEKDHIAHREDAENYGRIADGKLDYMHPNSISIETRATLAAYSKLTGKEYEFKPIDNERDFRELQTESEGLSEQDISEYHRREREIDEAVRKRLSGVFKARLLNEWRSNRYGTTSVIAKGNTFNFYKGVNPQTFHDIFEIVRKYLPNGELVDLHDSYDGVKCYLSEDGMSGFAVEADGNLVSVFNLSDKKGFLYAIKDLVVTEGATHLDCYNSDRQPFAEIYGKVIGWKTASLMDYNMEYDHDNIAENHGNPKVAFMVNNPDVEIREFDKDSYDAAQKHQLDNIATKKEEIADKKKKEKKWIPTPQTSKSLSIKNNNNNKDVYQRILKEQSESTVPGNKELGEIREILKRGSTETSDETNGENEVVKRYAQEHGFWYDDIDSTLEENFGKAIAQGGESVVYYDSETGMVIKAISPAYYNGALSALIDRIFLHNGLFGEGTALRLVGFGEDPLTKETKIIVEQNFIKGTLATQDDIKSFMKKAGFTEESVPGIYSLGDVRINDLNEVNVIKTPKGNIAVIDAEIHVTSSTNTQVQLTDDYQLPEISEDTIQPDTMSPLYKLSLQLDQVRINSRVNMIAHRISDGITRAISKKIRQLQIKSTNGNISEDEKTLLSQLSDEENGRKAGIPLIINDVLREVREDLQEVYDSTQSLTAEEIVDEFGVDNPEYLRDQYKILIDNYDVLFDMACDVLETSENIRLSRIGNKVTTNDSVIDENNDEEMFDDADEGERVHGNEGYTYKAREVNPHTNSRAVTRRVLSNLHKIDYKGNYELDDLGEIVYVPESVAYSALVNDLAKIVKHPTDFNIRHEDGTYSYPALENLQGKYPWIKEILSKLYKNPDLGSALYGDLCKTFVPYWTQRTTMDKDGKSVTQTIRVNAPVARQSIVNEVNTVYNEHQLNTDTMLWDKTGVIVNENATEIRDLAASIIKTLNDGGELSDVSEDLANILKSIGVSITSNELSQLFTENQFAGQQARQLATYASTIALGSMALSNGESLINHYRTSYENIADIIGTVRELSNSLMHRQGTNDYPSYSTPNYIDYVINGLKSENWKQFIMDEYGYDEFLYNTDTGKFKSAWLNMLMTIKDVRDNIDIKNVKMIEGIEYKDWTYDMIIKSFVTEFFSVPMNTKGKALQYAYYGFPIFSDSEMMNFIKMPRFIKNYKEEVTNRLVDLAKQELYRIKKIQDRKKAGASPIQRYDSNGGRFLFMPELNYEEVYVEGVGSIPLLDYINGLEKDGMQAVDKALKDAITTIMENNSNSFINEMLESKFFADEYIIVGKEDAKLREETVRKLSQFYWNNALAQSQIIQMMTTDLAYYKNYVDFQKRFKEVYASGNRLNTQSKYGRTIERTIYLSDKIVTSPTYNGIKKSLDKAVEDSLLSSEEVKTILDKFRNVNMVDAQAYRTLSSYRAVLDMQGKWTPTMDAAFDRFSSGKWSKDDFDAVWGVIKPFMFANLKVNDGLGGFQRVPHQNKNSEFLLLSFLNNLYQGNMMTNSPELTGLNKAMETFGIDVAMFESAVKAGGQGIIDISYSREKLAQWNKEHKTSYSYEDFKKYLDNKLQNNEISQEEYNKEINKMRPSEQEVFDYIDQALHDQDTANLTDTFEPDQNTGTVENKNVIHEIPYEHYMIAQPTVNHHVDAKAVMGSQARLLAISDMPEDLEITIDDKTYKARNAEGKNEIIDLYNRLLVENLLDDWEKVQKIFSDINSLQKKLISMAQSNPSYGIDVINALQIVEIDGVKQFNIPLHNPTIANKVEQLMLSVFKNNITRQYIKGAACVLVSNFGFDDNLKVQRNENGDITGFECYMPAHMKAMFENYLIPVNDNNGNMIGQRIDEKRVPKELLEGIGYRIPTEGKYSMANLVIKGFLPQQSGASIIMPAELTVLAGSDFDVDKLFLMLKEAKVKTDYDMKAAWKDFYADPENVDIKDDIDSNYTELLNQFITEQTSEWSAEDIESMTDDEYAEFDSELKDWLKKEGKRKSDLSTNNEARKRFSKWFSKQIKETDEIGKPRYFKSRRLEMVKYDTSKSPQEMSRAARNNMVVDIIRAIMSSPQTSHNINNYSGFDTVSEESDRHYIIDHLNQWREYKFTGKDISEKEIVKSVLNATANELRDFINRYQDKVNPLDPMTFIYFHNQNMVGGKLLAIFASNMSQQNKYQQSKLGISKKYQVSINGHTMDSLHDVYRDVNGVKKLISRNCAEFSAAAADNVKDPKLAGLMQSPENAYITSTMLRMGMTIKEIGLFFSLPFFSTKILEVLNSNNAKRMFASSELLSITSEELLELCTYLGENDDARARAILARILTVAESVRSLTRISRADSPKSAIDHTVAGALAQTMAVTTFHKRQGRVKVLTGTEGVIRNAIAKRGATKDEVRDALFKSDMPLLQAFYYLGIENASDIASTQFKQMSRTMRDNIGKLAISYKKETLPKSLINSYLRDATIFALSKSELFSEDIDKQRAYFLNKFPNEFIKNKKNHKLADYGIVKALSLDASGNIALKDAPRLMGVRDQFSRDLVMMLFNEDSEVRDFAINLFKYSYFADGLGWRVNGFSNFFNTVFLSSLPSYINTLREINFNETDNVDWDNYHKQFIVNHAEALFSDKTGRDDREYGDVEYINKKYVKNPNNYNEPYQYILLDGNLYEVNYAESSEDHLRYDKVQRIVGRSPVYNASVTSTDELVNTYNKNMEAMRPKEPAQTKGTANTTNVSNTVLEDFDMAELADLEDFNIDSDFESAVEDLESSGFDDAIADLEESGLPDETTESNNINDGQISSDDIPSKYDGNEENGIKICSY